MRLSIWVALLTACSAAPRAAPSPAAVVPVERDHPRDPTPALSTRDPAPSPRCAGERLVGVAPSGDGVAFQGCSAEDCPIDHDVYLLTPIGPLRAGGEEAFVVEGAFLAHGGEILRDCGAYADCAKGVVIGCDDEHVRVVLPIDYRQDLEPGPLLGSGYRVILETHRIGSASGEADAMAAGRPLTSQVRWTWTGTRYESTNRAP